MTRICFFRLGATPLFVPGSQDEFGGAEVRALTFARALAKQNHHRVSFAVRRHQALPRAAEGIEIVALPSKLRGAAKLFRSLHRRLIRGPLPYPHLQKLDADVVACFGIHDPTPNVVEAARRSGLRSIVFLTSSEDVSDGPTDTVKARRRQALRHFALSYADQVVVQTESQQQYLKARFGRTGVLIRNPIDCQVSAEQLNQPRRHVLWVGRADRHSKRADICFSLAKRCTEIPFRVVMHGGCPKIYSELQAIKPSNVTLERGIPLGDIEPLFATASVLINTSESEGFPNAFLQAAKYATPVVALSVNPDGFLSSSGCGDVAGSEHRMVDLIREYHAGNARVRAVGATARAYVQRTHELSARVTELDRLVTSLVTRHRAA